MATKYLHSDSGANWSTAQWWDHPTAGNHATTPGDGDIADLNGFTIAMNINMIPAAGTLALLRSGASNNSAGKLTVALNTLGHCTINCLTIAAGSNGAGFIVVSSTSGTAANILYINCSLGLTGATSGEGTYGLYLGPYSKAVVNGPVYGGNLTDDENAHGIYCDQFINLTINGNVFGTYVHGVFGIGNSLTINNSIITGSSISIGAVGIYGVFTTTVLNNCNLINGTKSMAYIGNAPIWNNSSNLNYIQFGSVKYAPELLDHQILAGVQNGSIMGTYIAPADADVWHDVPNGVSPGKGSKKASSIPNCTEENIKDGIIIDDVVGEYAIEPPNAPVITAVTAAGDDVTVSITGDVGATHHVLYRKTNETTWIDGGSLLNDGDIVLSNLTGGTMYEFYAVTLDDGVTSPPSNVAQFYLHDPALPTVAEVERWAVGILLALGVFKTAAVWKHQLSATEGGLTNLDKHAPCAFVGEQPTMNAEREGGYTLNRKITLVIVIAQKTLTDGGAARVGDDTILGTEELRSLVIAALDGQNPGGSLGVDDFYYKGAEEIIDMPKQHGVKMVFEANWLTN